MIKNDDSFAGNGADKLNEKKLKMIKNDDINVFYMGVFPLKSV